MLGQPRIKEGAIKSDAEFGYRHTYIGLGIYVFKDAGDYKIIAH